jgi:hypothetical protein
MPFGNISINIGGTTRQENTLGVPPEVVTELVKQQADHTALQRKEIARLAEALELKDGQIHAVVAVLGDDLVSGGLGECRDCVALALQRVLVRAALKIVYEADVPSEQQGAKLIEIAERFKALLATSLSTPGDTPKIAGLKNDTRTAIEAGDLASADELLAQVEAEQRQSLQRQ